jgi:hypothetical protein
VRASSASGAPSNHRKKDEGARVPRHGHLRTVDALVCSY